MLLEHVLPSLLRKPQAMIRWGHKNILFEHEVFVRLYKFLQKSEALAEVEFLRTLNLILNHPLSEVKAAIDLCMENPSSEKGFQTQVANLLQKESRPPEGIPEQKVITTNLNQYDQFIGGQTNEAR